MERKKDSRNIYISKQSVTQFTFNITYLKFWNGNT